MARYRCRDCGRGFSSRTLKSTYRQHRPDLNEVVLHLYASGMSQRRMAIVLGVDRKTIVRKFLFAATLARAEHTRRLERGLLKTRHVQFDEMETFEHTRLKPVAVAIAVRAKTGEVIDIQCSSMAYKGPLAAKAFAKYGPRRDDTRIGCMKVLQSVRKCLEPEQRITTDRHPRYPALIAKCVPTSRHHATCRTYEKTDRRNKNDELFTVNYTAAKIRNDLSRMGRRTWITTKKIERLQAHLDLYIAWVNGYCLVA